MAALFLSCVAGVHNNYLFYFSSNGNLTSVRSATRWSVSSTALALDLSIKSSRMASVVLRVAVQRNERTTVCLSLDHWDILLFDIRMSAHRNIIRSPCLQDATFLIIYFYRRSTCFRLFLRPSSGTRNCTCSFRYCQSILLLAAVVDEIERSSISSTIAVSNSIGWQYLKLRVQLPAPDDGRRNRVKHIKRL